MQRVEVQLEDDLTGGPADETVEFGIDGKTYAIDLSARHAAELRRQLGRFVEHARPARSRQARGAIRTAASRQRSRQIRAWAEQHGLAVAEHGRLPGSIVEQYETSQSSHQSAGRSRSRHSPAKRKSGSRRPQ
jgi:Lsr2